MQSFKYSVPNPPHDRPSARRRWLRWTVAGMLVFGVGGLALGHWSGGPFGWLFGNPARADEDPRAAQLLADQAEALLGTRSYAAAEAKLVEALERAPSSLANFRRARDARFLAGKLADPPIAAQLSAFARARLGRALGDEALHAKRYESALNAYERTLALAPQDAQALYGKGQALVGLGRLSEAQAAYTAAAAIAPEDLATAGALADLRVQMGDVAAASESMIDQLSPRAAKSDAIALHALLIEAWLRQGLSADEIRTRHHALAPSLAPERFTLALAKASLAHFRANPHWNQASYAQAIASAEGVLKDTKDTGLRQEARRVLAEAYAADAQRADDRSDFTRAASALERAMALQTFLADDPHRLADLYVQRAHLQTLTRQPDAVTRSLEAALTLDPANPCRSELAQEYGSTGADLLALNKASDAIHPLARAATLAPESPRWLGYLALALMHNGHANPLADAASLAGLSNGPTRAGAVMRGLLATGHAKEAAELARGLSGPEARFAAAETAAAAGRLEEARQILQDALASAPALAGSARLAELDLAIAQHARGHAQIVALHAAIAAERQCLSQSSDQCWRDRLVSAERMLATTEQQQHAEDLAHEAALRGLMLAPNQPGLALLAAQSAEHLGDRKSALDACEQGIDGIPVPSDPANASLRLLYGTLLQAAGRETEAIAALQTGLQPEVAAPPATCAALYFELALALNADHRRQEALDALHQYRLWAYHDPLAADRASAIAQLAKQLGEPG